MSTTTTEIVVAVDGSPASDTAVVWAAHEAAMRHAPARLIHVVQPVVVTWPIPPMQTGLTEWQEQNAHHLLTGARDRFAQCAGDQAPAAETEVSYANVIPALVDASKEAQMIVVGSRGLGAFGRLTLGSVSTGLVHHAHCPVAVIPVGGTGPVNAKAPVLLGIDGSPASETATALAFEEASRRKVNLVALHAWSDVAVFPALGMDWHEFEDEGREVLSERLAGWQERYPDVRVQRRLVCDKPGRWLVEESEHAQLVVVGSHGRGGFAGMLLGSVSTAVAHGAKAPVIITRGP